MDDKLHNFQLLLHENDAHFRNNTDRLWFMLSQLALSYKFITKNLLHKNA
jgi:hypothetical protein